MSKVKSKKHSTFIDMTAMSDVTVLLLTFFMLTATFLPKEPVQVTTPASVIEVKIPDNDLLTILIKSDGQTYLNFDKPTIKEEVLKLVGKDKNVEFSNKQITSFKNQAIIGVPFNELPAFLNMPMLDQDAHLKTTGIPTDSTNNQLKQWLQYAVMVYGGSKNFKIAVKADRSTEYPKVNNVISTLQDLKLNRFNLITTLKGMPEGY
jgi:biopolymer transport protein ExbD